MCVQALATQKGRKKATMKKRRWNAAVRHMWHHRAREALTYVPLSISAKLSLGGNLGTSNRTCLCLHSKLHESVRGHLKLFWF